MVEHSDRRFLLPAARACLVKDERTSTSSTAPSASTSRASRRCPGWTPTIPEEWLRKLAEAASHAEEKAKLREARLGQADGDVQEAPRGAEGAPRGRQQVDRHRRHLALRPRRLQPRRHPHRRRIGRQPHGGQGLGQARVPQPRRHASNSARATSRSRCAACAASPARARPTNSTSTAPSPAPRATPAGSTCKMRPERHNAVKVLLFLDIGGSMDDHITRLRGTVLGRARRVQAPRILLLPQLRL